MDAADEAVGGSAGSARDEAIEAAALAYAQALPPRPDPPELESAAQRSTWALDIAGELRAIRDQWAERDPGGEAIEISECWVGAEDLALYVRFDGQCGHRVHDLHLDVWMGGPAESVVEQASDIYHDLDAGGATQYVDELGFRWTGHPPENRGWRWSVHDQPRLHGPLPATTPLQFACGIRDALIRLAAEELDAHPHDPAFEECWVGEDLALYTRYHYNGELRGHRAADLTRQRLKPEFSLNARNLAKQLWLELGAAVEPSYVDTRGYSWSGDDPEAPVTWEYVVERMPSAVE